MHLRTRINYTNRMLCFVSILILTLAFDSKSNASFTERSIVESELVTETIKINFSNKSVVSEMQHTICSIKTDEIVAKAESTASRMLTGVCTSEEIMKALKTIEKTFLERIEKVEHNLLSFFSSKSQPVLQNNNFKKPKVSPFRTIEYLSDENLLKNFT